MVKTIYWESGKAMILDQVKLPHEVEFIACEDHLRVCRCIKEMNIRGAPAIGIAAAMGIALGGATSKAQDFDGFMRDMETVFADLLATRPTAVNIRWAVERIRPLLQANRGKSIAELQKMLVDEGQKILEEDIAVNRAIGEYGARFIRPGMRILTHCNAGSLATGGYGTATGPMRIAHEQGTPISVFADETRPLLQGARLTAWELKESGIDVTLICDNSSGILMKRGEIDMVIVGTDRTARNGDVCNKIGTYNVAVLAREHGIPFYVAAPLSSIDFTMASGDEIPIEERAPEEVSIINAQCAVAPEGIKVRNLAFDVTPARFVTAIITEKGAFRPRDLHLVNDPATDLDAIRL